MVSDPETQFQVEQGRRDALEQQRRREERQRASRVTPRPIVPVSVDRERRTREEQRARPLDRTFRLPVRPVRFGALTEKPQTVFGPNSENVVANWRWQKAKFFELKNGLVVRSIGNTTEVLTPNASETAVNFRRTNNLLRRGESIPRANAQRTSVFSSEFIKSTGSKLARTFVPGVWAKDWNKLSWRARTLNIAFDVITLVPLAGPAVRVGVGSSKKAILNLIEVAGGTGSQKARANVATNKIVNGIKSNNLSAMEQGAFELEKVGKETGIKALEARAQQLRLNAAKFIDISKSNKVPPADLEGTIKANKQFIENANDVLKRRKPKTRIKVEAGFGLVETVVDCCLASRNSAGRFKVCSRILSNMVFDF